MYLQHFSLSDFPFIQSGKDELFFVTPPARKQVLRVQHWLDCGHDFLLVSGAEGSGRASMVYYALSNSAFAVRSVTVSGLSLTDTEFLHYIALELGVTPPALDLMTLRHVIKAHLKNSADDTARTCLLIQQAEKLPDSQLNLLRDLAYDLDYYLPLCSVVLIGDAQMGKTNTRTIKSRPGGSSHHQIKVAPLTQAMTTDYINYRLDLVAEYDIKAGEPLFPDEVMQQIRLQTGGNLAAINRLADHALLAACAADKNVVSARHVTDAVRLLGWTQRQKMAEKRPRASIIVAERLSATVARRSDTTNTPEPSVHRLLRDVTTIGRAADCSIQLDQPDISPCQALIIKTSDGMFVRNEGGDTPVYLNASPVDSAALHEGDTLRIGDYEVSLTTGSDGTPALVALNTM